MVEYRRVMRMRKEKARSHLNPFRWFWQRKPKFELRAIKPRPNGYAERVAKQKKARP